MNARSLPLWLAALLASCVLPTTGEDPDAPIVLSWPAIRTPDGATDVHYEVTVHAAEQGLPGKRVRWAPRVVDTTYEVGRMPKGEYVWSVRVRYQRAGRQWASRWRTAGRMGGNAVEPQRGFRALVVR